MLYLWIKSLHILAVISWMAGMLYLPRLFIYHTGVAVGSEASETFKVMERRLLKAIINPAMVVSVVAGVWLGFEAQFWSSGWLMIKFVLVMAGLGGMHGYFTTAVRDFSQDRRLRTSRHWRIMNEVPTLIMIVVVILVVLKPF